MNLQTKHDKSRNQLTNEILAFMAIGLLAGQIAINNPLAGFYISLVLLVTGLLITSKPKDSK